MCYDQHILPKSSRVYHYFIGRGREGFTAIRVEKNLNLSP